MYRIIITGRAQKDLRKIPSQFLTRLRIAIEKLALDPFIGKKLTGEYAGSYSIRVWPYRVIYNIDKKVITVFITRVAHRQGAYN